MTRGLLRSEETCKGTEEDSQATGGKQKQKVVTFAVYFPIVYKWARYVCLPEEDDASVGHCIS